MRRLLLLLVVWLGLLGVYGEPQHVLGPRGGMSVNPLGCTDSTAPELGTTDPSGSESLPGTSYTLEADATDDGTIVQVCFFYYYCGASSCVNTLAQSTLIACDTTATGDTYSTSWSYPNCGAAPANNFSVWFSVLDTCGNTDSVQADDVTLGNRGC